MNILRTRWSVMALSGMIAAGVAQRAHAQNLITDGDFENFTTTGAPSSSTGSSSGGQLGGNVLDPGWVNTTQGGGGTYGYNFIYTTAAANSTGVNNEGGGQLELWNSTVNGNGVSFKGKNVITAPPSGGNFLAADPVYEESAITQVINSLQVGKTYNLYFDYAGAQQSGPTYTSTTTEYWGVTLGSTSSTTATLNNAAEGFTGWNAEEFTFTATSTSETLSFLAGGGPSGLPPFALLSDVSLYMAPEPSVVLASSLLLLPVGVRVMRKLRKNAAAQK